MNKCPSKLRKIRVHSTGVSSKCKQSKCFDCSMLECQHDCHETPATEDPIIKISLSSLYGRYAS